MASLCADENGARELYHPRGVDVHAGWDEVSVLGSVSRLCSGHKTARRDYAVCKMHKTGCAQHDDQYLCVGGTTFAIESDNCALQTKGLEMYARLLMCETGGSA